MRTTPSPCSGNANLAHVRYWRSMSFSRSARHRERPAATARSRAADLLLHPVARRCRCLRSAREPGPPRPGRPGKGAAWRRQLLASLPAEPIASPAAPSPGEAKDLWRRTACLLDQMHREGEAAAAPSAATPSRAARKPWPVCSRQCWRSFGGDGRWELLGGAAEAAAEQAEREPGQTHVLGEAIELLTTPDRLLALETVLQGGSAAEVGAVLSLTRMCPSSANRVLAQLLERLPKALLRRGSQPAPRARRRPHRVACASPAQP